MASVVATGAEHPILSLDASTSEISPLKTEAIDSTGLTGAIGVQSDVDMTEQTEEPPKRSGMKKLPNEILSQIFLEFDFEAPSSTRLKDQPILDITSSLNTTLKDCSLVCTRWRQIIIPILYQYTSLSIPDPLLPNPMPIMRNEHFPMLNFFRLHNLKPFIKTFTLCIAERKAISVLHVDDAGLSEFRTFWAKIFGQIEPLKVTIVCNPIILGMLTQCNIDDTDIWSFDMPYHILHLCRPALAPPPSPQLRPAYDPYILQHGSCPRAPLRYSPLFEAFQWRTLLLNEGSFIKTYKTYEFFQKLPPSILPDLLGTQADGVATHTRLLPSTVRDFSYIAIFPTSQHFHQIAANLPRLDRFYTQFVPQNNILKDSVVMSHLDPGDLWMERNSCYAYIMRELFSAPPAGNYALLKEFESGDHADEDAWEMAVEYVKRAGRGWKIERRGVFAKDAEEAERWEEENKANSGDGEDMAPSLLSVPHPNPNDSSSDPDVS